VSLVQHCAEQLTQVEQQIKMALVQAEVLHQDETGLSVAGKRHWVHVSATSTLTHYAAHRKRGKEALDAIGILPGFRGVSVHDGWRSYWAYDCQHATCNVHLLRDLTFLVEEQQQDWAQQMKDLLLSMKEAVEQACAQGRSALHPLEVADWQMQYQTILLEADAAQPRELSPPLRVKGRRKQSAARNLLDRLSKEQDAVLTFLHNLAVPLTIIWLNETCAWSKCNRRSPAAFAVSPELPPFVAFEATSRRCASKGWLCCTLWNRSCLVIRCFLILPNLNSYVFVR